MDKISQVTDGVFGGAVSCPKPLPLSVFFLAVENGEEDRTFALSMFGHDALPSTGPETVEPAALGGNFSHCKRKQILSPLDCFSPVSDMVTKMSTPRALQLPALSIITDMTSSLRRTQVWFWQCLGSLEKGRIDTYVPQFIV